MTDEVFMSKTLTLRLDDETYSLFKSAADGVRRNLSNFMEYATYKHVMESLQVTDEEMGDILENANDLRNGLKDVKKGKYHVVK